MSVHTIVGKDKCPRFSLCPQEPFPTEESTTGIPPLGVSDVRPPPIWALQLRSSSQLWLSPPFASWDRGPGIHRWVSTALSVKSWKWMKRRSILLRLRGG